ncbi:MAG: DsrE family protein [Hydrogenophilales bacterium]|nr:DsrE family protein [Hydrogenophilales bacterium]
MYALACAASILLTALSPAVYAANTKAKASAKERVAFQISDADPKKLYLALNAAKNVQTTYGRKNAVIEIVAWGPGVNLLTIDSEAGQRIDEAIKNGIKVVVCENTMKSLKLTEADMLPNLKYVPGGILELMQKQKQGYAYILP